MLKIWSHLYSSLYSHYPRSGYVQQIRIPLDEVGVLLNLLVTEEISFDKYLTQDEFLENPTEMSRRQRIKAAQNGVQYSERDIGKLLSSLADVAIQLENPELLSHVHSFKHAMQSSRSD